LRISFLWRQARRSRAFCEAKCGRAAATAEQGGRGAAFRRSGKGKGSEKAAAAADEGRSKMRKPFRKAAALQQDLPYNFMYMSQFDNYNVGLACFQFIIYIASFTGEGADFSRVCNSAVRSKVN